MTRAQQHPTDRLDKAVAMAEAARHEREAPAEPWRKVTVVLKERQILFLDRLALDIRTATGAAVARAEIIRALIDALEGAGMDLSAAGSEEEVRLRVIERLRGARATS